MSDLVFFNPQYTKRIIPASNDNRYALRLPMKYALLFAQLEDSVYAYKSKAVQNQEIVEEKVKEVSDRVTHVVRRGESLGSIARKYNVTVSNIKHWNRLKRETIIPGQKLTIYRSGSPMAQVTKSSKSGGKSSSSTTTKIHVVKKGETLSSIARKYGCTVSDIKKWNGMKSNTVKVKQKLKIKTKSSKRK